MNHRMSILGILWVTTALLCSHTAYAKDAAQGPLVKKMVEAYADRGETAAMTLADAWDLKVTSSHQGPLVGVILEPRLRGNASGIGAPFLSALGARVDAVSQSYMRVMVPFASLSKLAGHPDVRRVRAPIPAKALDAGFGAMVSESVGLTGAAVLQAAGVTGAGVKVAVVDLGFVGLTDAITAGELPADTHRVKGDEEGAEIEVDTRHGVGVSEHVLDMAPGVELYCIYVEDEVDLENAAGYIALNGIHIANHSVGWVNSSYYDDTGPLSGIVNQSRDLDGVFWAVAAGNDAECHWRGTWSDPDADNVLNFTALDEGMDLTVAYDTTGYLFLNWNQYGASVTDLDFYVLDKDGQIAGRSENWQTGTEDPAESVSFTYNSARAPYRIQIQLYAGPTTDLDMTMFSFYHDFEYAVAASSLMEPAEAHGAYSAAAVYFDDWNLPNPPPESFSSQGPTNDGRLKPDIAAPDGTTSWTYGVAESYGTSFSSPTVAGAAALLLEQDPTLTPADLGAALSAMAEDIGDPGPDTVFGAGKLHVESAACTGDPDCDDGLPCNGAETCDLPSGDCQPGTPVDCSDLDDACNVGACDAGSGLCEAQAANEGGACDDGFYCNAGETCQAGACAGGAATDCSGLDDQCVVGVCNEAAGQCEAQAANEGGACDDGLFCNAGETCQAGACTDGSAMDCSGLDDQCVAGVCNETTDQCEAQAVNEGNPCDDGDLCTAGETCQASACAGDAPVDCSYLDDVCNVGACDPGSGLCQAAPVGDGTPCGDLLFCNGAEACSGGACLDGPAIDCDDGLSCTLDACDEIADQCVNTPDHGLCDDALYCDGAETCDPVLGCLSGPAPDCDDGVGCTTDDCDEAADACENVADDAACADGQFCNGSESCDPVLDCQTGAAPCVGQGCDEAGDQCVSGQAPYLQTGVVVSGTDWVAVPLERTYLSMVVVGTPVYTSADLPGVVRIRNAAGAGFELRVETATVTPSVVAGIPVHYLVVEEGVYTEAEHGVKMEAARFLSTVTDNKSAWNGETRTYAQAYSAPVVLGQVMTVNDPDWSVFWCRSDSSRVNPPDGTLRVGKTVAEDTDTVRADEVVGYVVIESGGGTMGTVDGVLAYTAALGADSVKGVGDSPPYAYTINGLSTASVAVASQAAMDGGNGGWAVLYGANPVSPTGLDLAIDEDQVKDSERKHTPEQVGYIVFEEPPACSDDGDCDDGLPCNGAETCDVPSGGCQPGTPVDCSDLDDACNTGACVAGSGLCEAQAANEGGACDDGLYCNTGEACQAGACTGGGATDCSGLDDQCVAGVCDEVADQCEAQAANEGGACDDGLFCNAGETCQAGACTGGAATDCSGLDDQCVAGVCNEATDQCEGQAANEGGVCDDSDFCTTGETCQAGFCVGGAPADCSYLDDACNTGACDAGSGLCEAQAANEGGACDDGLYCNTGEACQAGACAGGGATDCSGLDDQCVAGVCDEVADQCEAQAANEGGACDDGLFCTAGETCQAGACAGGAATDCSGLDDQCVAGVCNEATDQCEGQAANEGGACDDGLYCNTGETCQAGACAGGAATDCSYMDDACNTGACDAGTGLCEAQAVADGTPCGDALFCNGSESCSGGICLDGPAIDCDDGLSCTLDACDEIADQCVNTPDHGLCDDALYCDGAETCDPVLGCLSGTAPDCDDGVGCTTDDCDEIADACENLADDAACDDGQFCNGSESCDPVLDCQAGAAPCVGQGCDEAGDQCVNGQAPYLQTGVVVSGTDWVAVPLERTYLSMVVVGTPVYTSADLPGVVRIRNATGAGFEFRVEAATATSSVVAGIPVHYMVVEEGVYTEAEHGVKMEAARFLSTVTDSKSAWNGETRAYAQAYSAPVVLGQVMTVNDPDWSVFWCRSGTSKSTPPNGTLRVGKTVAEDPDTARADEVLGYVVVESGGGTMGTVDGTLAYIAALGADTVRGVGNAPPYTYSISGLSSASMAIASQAAMDGGNGGWAVLYGANPVSPTGLALAIDEDQAKDSERKHTTEQVGYVVFE